MAAPKNNQFWKQRAKHGRDKIFSSPQMLWTAAKEYFEYQDKRELIEVDFRGKDASRVDIPHKPPYTIQGLCIYLDCNIKYINQLEDSLKGREDKTSKEFSYILTRIRQIIYTQKFEGAASGFYNASIISRDLGLTDKQQIETTGESSISINLTNPKTRDLLNKE